MRWGLLRRLVVRGAAGEDEIDAELRRDPTAAGERHAAGDRAAVPTAEAKAAAWDRVIAGDLPNAVFRATLGGLVDVDDTELLVPYVEKYFAEIGQVWSSWSSDMSSTFAEVAYPFLVTDQRTVDLTTAYLKEQNPPPALHRLLIEGRDGVSRAMRAQAKDHSAS
jgi:aminopeptidase N